MKSVDFAMAEPLNASLLLPLLLRSRASFSRSSPPFAMAEPPNVATEFPASPLLLHSPPFLHGCHLRAHHHAALLSSSPPFSALAPSAEPVAQDLRPSSSAAAPSQFFSPGAPPTASLDRLMHPSATAARRCHLRQAPLSLCLPPPAASLTFASPPAPSSSAAGLYQRSQPKFQPTTFQASLCFSVLSRQLFSIQ